MIKLTIESVFINELHLALLLFRGGPGSESVVLHAADLLRSVLLHRTIAKKGFVIDFLSIGNLFALVAGNPDKVAFTMTFASIIQLIGYLTY